MHTHHTDNTMALLLIHCLFPYHRPLRLSHLFLKSGLGMFMSAMILVHAVHRQDRCRHICTNVNSESEALKNSPLSCCIQSWTLATVFTVQCISQLPQTLLACTVVCCMFYILNFFLKFSPLLFTINQS